MRVECSSSSRQQRPQQQQQGEQQQHTQHTKIRIIHAHHARMHNHTMCKLNANHQMKFAWLAGGLDCWLAALLLDRWLADLLGCSHASMLARLMA